jgi:hypothetical protein
MNKMKIKYGFILFLLLIVGFNTSTFGLGIDFYSNKKNKTGSSLGVRFARSEGNSFPIIYCNLILLWL